MPQQRYGEDWYELSDIQISFCANNFWDGHQPLPLRIAPHPYALYDPSGMLNSRWSNAEAAAMMNAERFNNCGSVRLEDILGNQTVVEMPLSPYARPTKSRNAFLKQFKGGLNAISQ
jgi:hypothetical protein